MIPFDGTEATWLILAAGLFYAAVAGVLLYLVWERFQPVKDPVLDWLRKEMSS